MDADEKAAVGHVAVADDVSSGKPEQTAYHLEGGLRLTHSQDEDEPFKLNARVVMAIVGCSIAFAGSQLIPLSWFTLYTFIANDFGMTSFVWLKGGSSLGQIAASVTLGPLSDLLGRRIMLLLGIFCAMLGMILCGASPTSGGYIAGQTIAGFGLMTEELLAIAVTAELVPTKKRSIYGAAMIAGFIPWAPGVLYAQLLATVNWRWIGYMIAIWHSLALVTIGFFYHPPPRPNSRGLTVSELLTKIDFVGVALGLAGFVVLLVGLFWGGQEYPWNSAQVIATLTVGIAFIGIFVVWETFFAKSPLFPRRLVQVPRVFWPIMLVIFTAGINYVPLAVFWPIQSISVFNSSHVETGVNTLPVGICILGGAMISAFLCGRFYRRVGLIMTIFCVLQTAGVGGMTAIDENNINTVWGPLVIGLIGVGGVLFPNQIVVTVITPDDLLATVTSLTFTIRAAAQVVALAIFSNRLTANVTANATRLVPIPAVQAGIKTVPEIVALVKGLSGLPFKDYIARYLPQLTDPAKNEVLRRATAQAFNQSYPELYWIGFGFGVAACIASFVMGDVSKFMDEHVAIRMH